MKTVILLLLSCLCWITRAKYNVIEVVCNDSSEEGLHFDPSNDGVKGRYVLKWCRPMNKNVKFWGLDLSYKTTVAREKCNDRFASDGATHSKFEESVDLDLNCTSVCFVAYLDLIFDATCYRAYTRLFNKTIIHNFSADNTIIQNTSYYYIQSETLLQKYQYTDIILYANYNNIDDDIQVTWYLGYIPVTDYTVQLECINGTVAAPTLLCAVSGAAPTQVRCRARAPPACYRAALRHLTPWAHGFNNISSVHADFCHTLATPQSQQLAAPWWAHLNVLLWVLPTVLVVTVVLLALLHWPYRSWRTSNMQCSVQQKCLQERSPGAEESPSPGCIVLLYARDCEPVRRAARLLRELLLSSTGQEVVDLYRAETVSAAAAAGGEWVRALLQQPQVRVLLLHTPALALYVRRNEPAPDGTPALQAPLLAGRAAWRQPHPADQLLQLALRLLPDAAALRDPLPYRKYYVASVTGVPCDAFLQSLTPQRHYRLPEAAPELLQHLQAEARDARSRDLLQQTCAALLDFQKYVQQHPAYLCDELLLA